MRVITLDKTKELLGITTGDLDEAITRYIPIVDSKVKKIMRNRFNDQIRGITKTGSQIVEVFSAVLSGISYGRNALRPEYGNLADCLEEYLEIGTLVEGEGIPSDTYVEEVYYNGYSVDISGDTFTIPSIRLSNAATADNTNSQMFLGFNIAWQNTIAKGISWLINQENRIDPGNPATSKRIGRGAVSYGNGTERIDGISGMPAWFAKALPAYHRGH